MNGFDSGKSSRSHSHRPKNKEDTKEIKKEKHGRGEEERKITMEEEKYDGFSKYENKKKNLPIRSETDNRLVVSHTYIDLTNLMKLLLV